MNKLHASLGRLSQWFDQRPLRERAMLAICVLVVLFFFWDLLLLKPLAQQKHKLKAESSELSTRLIELAAQEQIVHSRRDFDPDRENKQRLKVLETELQQSQQRLQLSVVNLISPQQMPELLKDLLQRQRILQLSSLENLPAEPLQVNGEAMGKLASPTMYRHRLRMEFSGDYLATLNYLQELEKMPRKLVWEQLQIETQEYPQAKVLLQVYTLSLKESWIGG